MKWVGLAALAVFAFALAVLLGPAHVPVAELLRSPIVRELRLPRAVPHQHFSEGPEDTLAVQTMTPGLDFDYVLETIFGLGSEGRLGSVSYILQGLVMIRKMEGPFALAILPLWFQKALAWMVTPFAYRLGYRAVYQRFSGEEW